MTDLLTIILLGIVEGVTEFLPVSSTGHLILAGALLGFKDEASGTFEIVIQLGAILSVIVLYWRRFWDVFVGLGRRDPRAIAFTRNVALAFLPSAVIGLIVYKMVKAMLESPMTVAVALVVGGIAILVIERLVRAPKVTNVEQMSWKVALGIGIIQCLAMVPGVSRSGATIMGALGLGVDRKTAAEFSFFLAVPTMLAASAYDLYKNAESIGSDGWLAIAIGFVVSFVVALLVIRWFLGIVTRHGFTPFAWYRIVAGGVAIVWLSQL
ncbi:undecaprenyl-diphosphate phosphatase [Sphingomonas desiccabilis]|uniref:Undecaprenyl-diphosphatase n=1 Tax=Sphingomonas desiccabilis TaxID=429134 RepID=A0A4V1QNY7_9SPHN|nr:undecaprenyl-diphosphate phosphatase [Sphingomonas desiccabilis]MBB3911998.1 undecaprenyl-diphosphatase [Sphingomonas desiccabilis]RXZ31304.1 undecaprenyl-diphosphate phosphatase [Sphingomonas desiccabilis]